MPSALLVVAALLVVLGGALGAKGAADLRKGSMSRAVSARVVSHTATSREMITGARGAKRDVALIDVTFAVVDEPTASALTITRAPDLAKRAFAIGSSHTLFVDDDGAAHTEAPTSTLALVEVAGGLALALVGLALFAFARRSA